MYCNFTWVLILSLLEPTSHAAAVPTNKRPQFLQSITKSLQTAAIWYRLIKRNHHPNVNPPLSSHSIPTFWWIGTYGCFWNLIYVFCQNKKIKKILSFNIFLDFALRWLSLIYVRFKAILGTWVFTKVGLTM